MSTYTLVTVLSEVVVPVEQGGSLTGGKGQRIHRHSTGDICLTGSRDKLVTQHGHGHTRGAAIVLLQRVPALDGDSLYVVRLNPILYGNTELRLYAQFLLVVVRNLCIVTGTLTHRFELRVIVADFLSSEENLTQVSRYDGDTVTLQQFLTGTAGVEAQWACTDLSDTAVAQSVDHPADSGKLVDILGKEVTIYRIGVQGGIRERNTILVEVVADGDLSAERHAGCQGQPCRSRHHMPVPGLVRSGQRH